VRRALEEAKVLDPIPASAEVQQEEAIRLLYGAHRPPHSRDFYNLIKELNRA